MDTRYQRLVVADADLLTDFLVNGAWPFHGPAAMDRDVVRRRVEDGFYEGRESRTFWMVEGGGRVGLIRLFDLADVPEGGTPMFDLRIASAHRGRGLGRQGLAWLTGYLFTEFPGLGRIEGTTRQDNRAMRRTFLSGGYAKEAHYRDAWPGTRGRVHDAVGYAILRRDWLSGETTPPDWDDEMPVS
ncbi:GNAT family N-acetyltransferase [Streptomyces sp. NBC_00536]|uniref:GNAT family N-acetyltransferase n=1 Tax=Streptomyces sp. NBC_00536 TaxID=2975769 RepID=UPI002E8121A4|nr:GNAT family protein [Streptomyces sp. NBC_00536]WUC77037.1 GNAT family N-acetyltransferase [Streptomyces sp. NBC_00536]